MVIAAAQTMATSPHTGFKRTEIGLIPDDWDLRSLDAVAVVTSGKRLPKGHALVERPTPHPYIRVSDMRSGTVDSSEIRFVPEDVAPTIKRYRIFSDEIYISVAGTLGLVGIIPVQLSGANLTEN